MYREFSVHFNLTWVFYQEQKLFIPVIIIITKFRQLQFMYIRIYIVKEVFINPMQFCSKCVIFVQKLFTENIESFWIFTDNVLNKLKKKPKKR